MMLESGVYHKEQVDLPSLFKELSKMLPEQVGAVASFLGVVKKQGLSGNDVKRLELESYEEEANRAIVKICDEVKEKYRLNLVKIYHLVGSFEVGEPIVLVYVAGESRKQVFPALQDAVERYKREAFLFKKELYVDGSHAWVSHA